MVEARSVLTLRDFTEKFRGLSLERFLSERSHPWLVEMAIKSEVDADRTTGFHTEHISASAVKSHYLKPGMEEAFPVTHREGAVFSSQVSVGRTKNVDIPLARSGVSKFHAYFHHDDEGRYFLTDKRSTNGTFVDGTRLVPSEPFALRIGARVQFGTHGFRFLSPTAFFESLLAH